MSIETYISAIQETKTYQAGLISFQEYSFRERVLGLIKTLPSVPRADEDRQIVVMEIKGNQPNILTVLKDPAHSIQLTTKDVDKLLFIFVEMRPHTLNIAESPEGYRLSDGHQINAQFSITYQVEDAKLFWKGHKDQLLEFERAILNAAKRFFLNTSSDLFIGFPADSKKSLENHIKEAEIGAVKHSLENDIYQNCTIAGIQIQKVIADVHIGQSLYEYLGRIHEKLYGRGGVAERYKIDQIIDCDKTFAPHSLRAVINALDMRLLENFYREDWNVAMRKVTERLAEKKDEFMKSIEEKELDRMERLIDTAERLGLDDDDKKELKYKAAKNLLSMADNKANPHTISDQDYITTIIAPPKHQLPDHKIPQPDPDDGDNA
ncbi:MAG: hypothetical protein GY737_27830 [Desulfobacteraceae bacterium]|nr:hypothetical protein [Desulfobacteraceae bacterium]